HICHGTSSATMMASDATISAAQNTTRPSALASAAVGATCINPSISSRCAEMTATATPPTSSALASALNNSTAVCAENMRLMPDNRLSFEKLGCNGLVENTKPPNSTLLSTATAI